jgi:benzylsuccinate CoA-transferase BbsF subunit
MLLEGLRVLDFGWVWAGAVPGQMLAFLGAEVIKVESQKRLDYMRLGPPIVGTEPDPEQQPMFHNVNRGKLSLALDFTSDLGREIILDLVGHCDVVIENFSPGVLEKYGLSYEELTKRKPDLVMLSLSGGGQTGGLRDLRSYASTIAAYTGLDSLCGYQGEEPLGIQQSYPDPNASLHGAVGIMAALLRRRRTGEGDHLDLSQLEAGLMTVGEAMAAAALFGEVPETAGNQPLGGEIIHDCYECSGETGWVAVVVEEEVELGALAALLGADEESDPEQLSGMLAIWCRGRSAVEAMVELQQAGVSAGTVTTAQDRFTDEHFRHRGVYEETEHPVIGWEVVYSRPWQWSHEVQLVSNRAPMMGEANEYVLCELLGRSSDEYHRLIEEGVLG